MSTGENVNESIVFTKNKNLPAGSDAGRFFTRQFIVNAINKLRLPVPICTEVTQSSDVQGNINKIIIVKFKFILTFTIILL